MGDPRLRHAGAAERFVAFAVLSGSAVAAQARINATLAVRLQDAVLAAFVSFATGLVLVVLVVGVSGAARRSLVVSVRGPRPARVRWWYLLGGLGGAAAVIASTAVVPRVGVAAFTVVIVSGQVLGGLLVDRFGIGPGGHRSVSRARLGAAGLAICAVATAALGHEAGAPSPGAAPIGTTGPGWPIPLLLVLAALAGIGVSAQQAVNARLRLATGHAMVATLVNFIGGTTATAVVYGLVAGGMVGGVVFAGPGGEWPVEPWLYLGGPIGVAYIALNSVIVPVIGVLRQSIAVLVGMLSGAVVLDLVLPAAEMPPFLATAASITLAVAAVMLVAREQRPGAARMAVGSRVAENGES